ncbi:MULTISPECIES: response regulator [unclassified Fusibacter]|uniref:response regulator n=1 Tax=unclassified Fusibacter TaxID=2624464 RepID=UPI0010128201|nr:MULTISPECIES: response regulator [unclassified Fusibacter]MCK8061076.1 response regulator [Fusibacter sp. A2]NPE20470.1 response regulator [Fusibacter sp. A1]RXV63674.1 response regulator [Fusibacter sp. A1]
MKRILIIDDNADIRYALSQICDFKGWEPKTASLVKEGLEILMNEEIDLILIDYHMPKINGLEGVKMIREKDPDVPIIVLTVDEKQQVADLFISNGANDFALKPIKAPDLISRISVHLKFSSLKKKSDNADSSKSENTAQYRDYTKGININTLDIIIEFMKNNENEYTIEEISENTGLAYQTVHRYLKHLLEYDVVRADYRYGKIGRPKQQFKWNSLRNCV